MHERYFLNVILKREKMLLIKSTNFKKAMPKLIIDLDDLKEKKKKKQLAEREERAFKKPIFEKESIEFKDSVI